MKSNKRRKANFYKKQTGMTFAGTARIQENLRSVCLRSTGRTAEQECIIKMIGDCFLKDGTVIQNGYQHAVQFTMKNQKYQFKVLKRNHSMNFFVRPKKHLRLEEYQLNL